MKMPNFIKTAYSSIRKNAPGWLTGISVASTGAAVIFAILDTRKFEEKKKELKENATRGDKVKLVASSYYRTIIFSGLSVTTAIESHMQHTKRQNALMAAYTLTTNEFLEYRNKVKEVIGESKEKKVISEINKDRIEEAGKKEIITIPDDKKVACYEPISKQIFYANIEEVKRAINNLNAQINTQDFVSVNEYLYELPGCELMLGEHGEINGDYIGWSIFQTGLIDIRYDTETYKGIPCFVLYHRTQPVDKFNSIWG